MHGANVIKLDWRNRPIESLTMTDYAQLLKKHKAHPTKEIQIEQAGGRFYKVDLLKAKLVRTDESKSYFRVFTAIYDFFDRGCSGTCWTEESYRANLGSHQLATHQLAYAGSLKEKREEITKYLDEAKAEEKRLTDHLDRKCVRIEQKELTDPQRQKYKEIENNFKLYQTEIDQKREFYVQQLSQLKINLATLTSLFGKLKKIDQIKQNHLIIYNKNMAALITASHSVFDAFQKRFNTMILKDIAAVRALKTDSPDFHRQHFALVEQQGKQDKILGLLTTPRYVTELQNLMRCPADAGLSRLYGGTIEKKNEALTEEARRNVKFEGEIRGVNDLYTDKVHGGQLTSDLCSLLENPDSTLDAIANAKSKLEQFQRQLALGLRCSYFISLARHDFPTYTRILTGWKDQCFLQVASPKPVHKPATGTSYREEGIQSIFSIYAEIGGDFGGNFGSCMYDLHSDESSQPHPEQTTPSSGTVPPTKLKVQDLDGQELNAMLSAEKKFSVPFLAAMQIDALIKQFEWSSPEATARINQLKQLLAQCKPDSTVEEVKEIQRWVETHRQFVDQGQVISSYLAEVEEIRTEKPGQFTLEAQSRINSLIVLKKFCYGEHVSPSALNAVLLSLYEGIELTWKGYTDIEMLKAVSKHHSTAINRLMLFGGRIEQTLTSIHTPGATEDNPIVLTNPTFEELRDIRRSEKLRLIHEGLDELKSTVKQTEAKVVERGEVLKKLVFKTQKLLLSSQEFEKKSLHLKHHFQESKFSIWLTVCSERSKLLAKHAEQRRKLAQQMQNPEDTQTYATIHQEPGLFADIYYSLTGSQW